MKKGISRWAFPSDWATKQCLRLAKRAGFEGIELTIEEKGELTADTDQRSATALRLLAENEGIEISSLATGLFWKYPLTSSNPELAKKGQEIGEKMLEIASWLGTDAVLIVPGIVEATFIPEAEVLPYETCYGRALAKIRGLCERAHKQKVKIGIENVWNNFLLSPLEMKRFLEDIGSPSVGCYFDVGNCLTIGQPQDWIRTLAGKIVRVHLKDFRRSVGTIDGFVDLLEGDVNWPEVMAALRDIRYEGYLVAEMFPYRYHPEAVVWNTSRSMDFIMARGVT